MFFRAEVDYADIEDVAVPIHHEEQLAGLFSSIGELFYGFDAKDIHYRKIPQSNSPMLQKPPPGVAVTTMR